MTIKLRLNGQEREFTGDPETSLLTWLRRDLGITSVKDGCSGQGFCGACTVEVNGKAALSCLTPLKKLQGAEINTLEGLPDERRELLAKAFTAAGAVQCGFCTPGMLMSTELLLRKNPQPTEEEIRRGLQRNFCRCTGYTKIVDAVQMVAAVARGERELPVSPEAGVGKSVHKYGARERALGTSPFVADLRFPQMVYGALKFSDHPRARVLAVHTEEALRIPGVLRVFTGKDVPGERYNGLIVNDWPLMVVPGETTHYVGDVLAGVVAETEEQARAAVELIRVEYEVLEPLLDMEKAEESPVKVHGKSNLLETCVVRRGEDVDRVLAESAFVTSGVYTTQRIEHAFLETEACVARPWSGGVELFSAGQGIYEDQRQVARLLALPRKKVKVNLVPNGGGFGGKEDLSVQGHAALFAFHLQRPVMVRLTRDESIVMHPKRHPIRLEYTLGCDSRGRLTALKARILGDTGAYASVGAKVLERAAGHATGAYFVPHVDIVAKTVYTNNLPCGAMRGFGANQAVFALESCVEDLCLQGGFDPWQFRWDNALVPGLRTATGQKLGEGVGVRASLEAVRAEFQKARWAGLAAGIKNSGVGNGMIDESRVKIIIRAPDHIELHPGWTEMGQGVFTVALQVFCEETGLPPEYVEVKVTTAAGARAGMTTSSRATALVGNAILAAVRELRKDLEKHSLEELVGRTYSGQWVCDWTTAPGAPGEAITHYSYSYAAQVVILNERGEVSKVVAAHDAGRIINPLLFTGQIEGSVHMGLGYALSEDLPLEGGQPRSTKMKDLGLLKARETPEIRVVGVEVPDPVGPYGAKGVGEIGLVPTAAAVANAFRAFDGRRRFHLPLGRKAGEE